jgi:hypothetical protein
MLNGNNGITDLKSPIMFWLLFVGWLVLYIIILTNVAYDWDQFYKNFLLSFSVLLSKGLPLCFLVYIFDLITPGAFLKKVSEDPYSCAAVIVGFLLAYGMLPG